MGSIRAIVVSVKHVEHCIVRVLSERTPVGFAQNGAVTLPQHMLNKHSGGDRKRL